MILTPGRRVIAVVATWCKIALLVPSALGTGVRADGGLVPLSSVRVDQARGQAPSSAIAGDLDAADRLLAMDTVEEARRLYESAAVRARAAGNSALEARALIGLAALARGAGQYAEARDELSRALRLAESADEQALVSRAASSMGILCKESGARAEVRGWYDKALTAAVAAGDLRQKASVLMNLVRVETVPIDEAIRADEEAAAIAVQLRDVEMQAGASQVLGERLSLTGNYAQATAKLLDAARLFEEAGVRGGLAEVLTALGRVYRLEGRAGDAIPIYRRGRTILEGLGDVRGVIQNLNATAIAYATLEDNRAALSLYEEAYKLALELKSPALIDFMQANLAGGLLTSGEYARAARLLEDVLNRQVEQNPGIRHNQLSLAYLGLGRAQDALAQSNTAVDLSSGRPYQEFTALFQRSAARDRLGDFAGALSDAIASAAVLEGLRAKLPPLDIVKQGFSASYQRVYSRLIGLYQRNGEPEKALQLMELARSRAFLDLLATRDVHMKTSAQAAMASLRDSEGQLLSTVTTSASSVEALHTLAGQFRSTLVSYWVSDDALFIAVVPVRGPITVKRVEVERLRLAELVEQAGAVVSGETPGRRGAADRVVVARRTSEACRILYALVIKPVKPLLPATGARLTIIPHGPLMRLSFAALPSPLGRYLIEDYSLHYLPAAAAQGEDPRPTDRPKRNFLFVADPLVPDASDRPPLRALPGAREEIGAVARLVPPQSTTSLIGARAARDVVVASMGGTSVLHFATHGVVREDSPLDSYLALGPSPGGRDDGRLTAEAVYGLDVSADLVVLASCRSAGGKLTGEGQAVLIRAFFYAGARSILASVWDVPDQPANQLLPAFYRAWLRGESRVDALRSAQLHLLRDLRAGRVKVRTAAGDFVLAEHPSLWAGFVLIGQP